MTYTIYLKIKPETYQEFKIIYDKLQAGTRESQAKPLGENFAQVASEVIDQAFGHFAGKGGSDRDSQKVFDQVKDALIKYLPWSVSFFGNERLIPLVQHFHKNVIQHSGQSSYVTYPVNQQLVDGVLDSVEKMKQGQNQYASIGLKGFIKVVDQGVTSLIREPKDLMKFNFVADKTLNGVITLTTQLAYKRFEKLATIYDAKNVAEYLDHFLVFLNKDDQTNVG